MGQNKGEKFPILLVGENKKKAARYAEDIKLHRPYFAIGTNDIHKVVGMRLSHVFVINGTRLSMQDKLNLKNVNAKNDLGVRTIGEIAALDRVEVLEARIEALEMVEE